MSTINREVGKAPVDPGFARVRGRSLWAIPWMEDDPALTSPQLWAGRMRRDAADALRYGCDGLLGIHWRTRVLSANVLALARAAWDQSWNTLPRRVADDIGPITGQYLAVQGPEDLRRRAAGRRLRGRPRPRLRLSPEGPQRDLQRDPAVRRGRRRPGPRPRLRRHHPGAEGRREPRHLRPRGRLQGPRPDLRRRRGRRREPGHRFRRPHPLPGRGRHRRRRARTSSRRSTAAGRPSSTTRRTGRRPSGISAPSTSTAIGSGPSSAPRRPRRSRRSSPASTAATPSR